MLRDPLFKACTRPAMLFGAPMKPVLLLFGAALLVGVWVAFVSRAAAVVCVALAIPAWLAMRQVSAHDEHRLGQHLMRVALRARQRSTPRHRGARAYGPSRQRRSWA